jgi:hypothetical protein
MLKIFINFSDKNIKFMSQTSHKFRQTYQIFCEEQHRFAKYIK